MAMAEKQLIQKPKITEIENLDDLKEYSCPRYRHMKDWYLKCLDCVSLKSCSAGQQAVKLMDESTKMKIPDPKTNQRGYIEYVFSQKEPLKILLTDGKNIRPTSIYARVHLWKKNFPDLEEKYQMMDKVRFLWSNPFRAMKVEDILKLKFPQEGPEHDFNGKYAGMKIVDPTPKKKTQEGIPMPKNEGDTITLEDFLKQNEPNDAHILKPAPKEKVPDAKICAEPAGGNGSDSLDIILEKLRKNIADYKQKIQQAEEQMAAVLTVKKLMQNGVE